jgi:hypothetical protein
MEEGKTGAGGERYESLAYNKEDFREQGDGCIKVECKGGIWRNRGEIIYEI